MRRLTLDHLPDDPDGRVLQGLAKDGSDLSRPMFIDFQVAVPDESSAKSLAIAAKELGYRVGIYPSPNCSLPWTCECSTRMLATYEGVIAIQDELSAIGARFGGHPDGWGTFGNGPTGQPPADREGS